MLTNAVPETTKSLVALYLHPWLELFGKKNLTVGVHRAMLKANNDLCMSLSAFLRCKNMGRGIKVIAIILKVELSKEFPLFLNFSFNLIYHDDVTRDLACLRVKSH